MIPLKAEINICIIYVNINQHVLVLEKNSCSSQFIKTNSIIS